MGKKKTSVPKKPTEIQNLNYKFLNVIEKVRGLDDRLGKLISYTEYIAANVDLAVSYTEFVTNLLSKDRSFQSIGKFGIVPNEKIPSFAQFKIIKQEKDDAEIPF